MDKIIGLILLVLVAVILWGGYMIYQNRQECAARAGQMVGTGEYTTTYVMIGKVLTPIRTEKTVCKIVEK